jgi:hypothetical protein
VARSSALFGGGGIFNFNSGGTVILLHSTLLGNMALQGQGGGLQNAAQRTTAQIINSTITDNFAGFAGGGAAGGALTILNSTIARNQTGVRGAGGGLDGSGIVLLNTILARNTAPQGPDCRGVVTSLGTNLIGDPTGCTITLQPTDLTGDPGLGAFTDNGTPGNGHIPLRRGSPAIDAGNDAACPPTDQLGRRRVNIRKVGTSICDIGAIEFRRHDKDPAEASD